MTRLKTKDIATTRESLLLQQNNKCALCGKDIDDAVLDHNHKTGVIRAVLHRGCNALEGIITNRAAMSGITDMPSYLRGLADYLDLHQVDQTGLLHPTHKTAEEKKERAKKKAKIAYNKRKLNKTDK